MLASDWFMLVFRIVHILAGTAWFGSVFLLVVFIQPSAAAIAPASAPFMTELLGRRRLVDWILTLAAITVLGGAFLYWHDWHLFGSFSEWTRSRFGEFLTIGALAALAAFGIGDLRHAPHGRALLRAREAGRRVGRAARPGGRRGDGGAPGTPEDARAHQPRLAGDRRARDVDREVRLRRPASGSG